MTKDEREAHVQALMASYGFAMHVVHGWPPRDTDRS
jgi:hypothetical protein